MAGQGFRRRVSIWLREGQLHIAYRDAILAQYAYRYDRKARRLQAVDTPHLFRTPYASPQLEFWELDDEQWHKIARRPYERHPLVAPSGVEQMVLSVGLEPAGSPQARTWCQGLLGQRLEKLLKCVTVVE
jgi:hypothetical protein